MTRLSPELLLVAVLALLAAGALGRGVTWMRRGGIAAGLLAVAWASARGHAWRVQLAGLALAAAAAAPWVLAWARRGAAGLSAEEEAMRQASFPTLPATTLRELLDQGLWLSGRPGETLLTEGEPVAHLFYLSAGSVRVVSGGQQIATSGPGHFFGELDVLAHAPAIATVTLTAPGRFWCVAADALEAFLAANPRLRPAMEVALVGEVRQKIRERNRRLVELEAERDGAARTWPPASSRP